KTHHQRQQETRYDTDQPTHHPGTHHKGNRPQPHRLGRIDLLSNPHRPDLRVHPPPRLRRERHPRHQRRHLPHIAPPADYPGQRTQPDQIQRRERLNRHNPADRDTKNPQHTDHTTIDDDRTVTPGQVVHHLQHLTPILTH